MMIAKSPQASEGSAAPSAADEETFELFCAGVSRLWLLPEAEAVVAGWLEHVGCPICLDAAVGVAIETLAGIRDRLGGISNKPLPEVSALWRAAVVRKHEGRDWRERPGVPRHVEIYETLSEACTYLLALPDVDAVAGSLHRCCLYSSNAQVSCSSGLRPLTAIRKSNQAAHSAGVRRETNGRGCDEGGAV